MVMFLQVLQISQNTQLSLKSMSKSEHVKFEKIFFWKLHIFFIVI